MVAQPRAPRLEPPTRNCDQPCLSCDGLVSHITYWPSTLMSSLRRCPGLPLLTDSTGAILFHHAISRVPVRGFEPADRPATAVPGSWGPYQEAEKCGGMAPALRAAAQCPQPPGQASQGRRPRHVSLPGAWIPGSTAAYILARALNHRGARPQPPQPPAPPVSVSGPASPPPGRRSPFRRQQHPQVVAGRQSSLTRMPREVSRALWS